TQVNMRFTQIHSKNRCRLGVSVEVKTVPTTPGAAFQNGRAGKGDIFQNKPDKVEVVSMGFISGMDPSIVIIGTGISIIHKRQ
ncbi:MAG: hypothetical protein WA324_17635, partial [Bryobacteraceae bacterium]